MTSRKHADDGASAVIVAISLLLLFGAGAIAVDLGSMWETKRDLVVDTDAAALAAGRLLLGSPCLSSTADAEDVAEDYVEANASDYEGSTAPTTTVDCTARTVEVEYGENAHSTLSPAVGVDELPVSAMSKVGFRFVGGGLRPFTVCMEDPEIQDWVFNGNGNVPGSPAQFDLEVAKQFGTDHTGACGGAAGNWGLVCFVEDFYDSALCKNSGGESADTSENSRGIPWLIINGYEGDVDLEGPGPEDGDCDLTEDTAQDCDGRTGTLGNAVFKAIDAVMCPSTTPASSCAYQFPILGVSAYTSGSGSNATLHPTHFVGVVIRPPAPDPDYSPPTPDFIRFELVDIFDSGSVVDAGTLQHTLAICETDGSPATVAC